jgi:hypothetical protein
MDYREIDRPKLLARVRTMHPSAHTSSVENSALAAAF